MKSCMDIWRIMILSVLLYERNFVDLIFGSDDFETTVLVATTFYVCKETNERNLFFLLLMYTCEFEENVPLLNECPENVVINMITTFQYMRLIKLYRVALLI
jgi:hypothetical protein